MSDLNGGWIGLFSGGKDSSYSLYRAMEDGLDVELLLTVEPNGDSYMYHVPEVEMASVAAERIGIPIRMVDLDRSEISESDSSAERGDAEVETLAKELRVLSRDSDVKGVIAGAVESEFQNSRIGSVCDELGLNTYTPLWQREPESVARDIIDAGFDIRIIQVASAGLDESWLGRRIDEDSLDELLELRDEYGVHPLGEGGEFETLVVDGPHMSEGMDISYETSWDGRRGRIRVKSVE